MPGSLHCREIISEIGSSAINVKAIAGTSRSTRRNPPPCAAARSMGVNAIVLIFHLRP
jgi:hypothetical protein